MNYVFIIAIVAVIITLPKEASYVFMYSDVMNWETSAVLPTPAAPVKHLQFNAVFVEIN